jgi:hypothetical protein
MSENIIVDYLGYLARTIKKDKVTQNVIFLTGISAFSLDPLNLFLRGPSSIGKTYNVTETLKFFPSESRIYLGGLSPTSLYHDFGVLIDGDNRQEIDPYKDRPAKEDFQDADGKLDRHEYREAQRAWAEKMRKAYYLVDLRHKILVFLEAPSIETFNKLRPILSHDVEEISYKFTDRPGGGPLQTMHVKLKGWPATIFCTTSLVYLEDLATRSFTHTPDMNVEKYQEAIRLTGCKASTPWEYRDEGQEFSRLRDYLQAVIMKLKLQNKVVIPYAEKLATTFNATLPRDMRDYHHLQTLIEVSALLNYPNRPIAQIGNERWLLATFNDLDTGLSLYLDVEETTRSGIAGNIINFFKDVVKPLCEQSPDGVGYVHLAKANNELGRGRISTKRVSDFVEALREVGYVDTERDENDKRRNLVQIIKNGGNVPISSAGRLPSLFTFFDLEKWLDSAKNYSAGEVTLYNNELKQTEISIEHLFKTYFPAEYSKILEKPLEPETVKNKDGSLPPEHSGTSLEKSTKGPGNAIIDTAARVLEVEGNSMGAILFDQQIKKLNLDPEKVRYLLKSDPRFVINQLSVSYRPSEGPAYVGVGEDLPYNPGKIVGGMEP